jgi:hypothetical protein
MTTRPKQTEQNIIADGRRVAAAVRRHIDLFTEADARREEKLLSSERLERFESYIEALDVASGNTITGSALMTQTTTTESEHRTVLYEALVDVRAEVKVAYKSNPAIGRVFGVGRALSSRSTPMLLKVGRAVLTSWQDQELRAAAERAGITAARIGEIAEQVVALGEADTAQNAALTQGRGRTLTKRQLLRVVRSETAYVREVAAVVLRRDPALLEEFASTLPRRVVQPRSAPKATTQATTAGQEMRPESLLQVEQVTTTEKPAQG